MWAMEQFRHKTTKTAFRTPYFLCVGANVVVLGGAGYYMYSKGGAGSQAMLNDLLNSKAGRLVQSEARKTIRRMGRR